MPTTPAALSRWRTKALLHRVMMLACSLGLAPAACGNTAGTPPQPGRGEYALRRVGEGAPPVEVHRGPWRDATDGRFYNRYLVRVESGKVELDERAFRMVLDVSIRADGRTLFKHPRLTGQLTRSAKTLEFIPDYNRVPSFLGSLGDSTVTVRIDLMGKGVGLDYVFRR